MAINHVTLSGKIVLEPNTHSFGNGQSVVKLRILVTRNIKNRQTGEWESKGSFFNVTCWRDQAVQAAQLQKGDQILLIGRLEQEQYEKKDGTKVDTINIVANEIAKLIKPAQQGQMETEAATPEPATPAATSGGDFSDW